VLLGRAVHRLGCLTYPREPAKLCARVGGGRVTVEWELAPRRRGAPPLRDVRQRSVPKRVETG
jgi:hypothetical protein